MQSIVGRFFLFLQPAAAAGNGHIAAGFQTAAERFTWSSMDNPIGAPYVPSDTTTGTWFAEGSEVKMLRDVQALSYSRSKCVAVVNPKVDCALAIVRAGNDEYVVVINDCLTFATRIMEAYGLPGATGFLTRFQYPAPVHFFDAWMAPEQSVHAALNKATLSCTK